VTETAKKKSSAALRTIVPLLIVVYLGWSEVRIRNLQALTDLAFDASSCGQKGDSLANVKECFESRGHKVRTFDASNDMVDANVTTMDLFPRTYAILIGHDKNGKVNGCCLYSFLPAFF